MAVAIKAFKRVDPEEVGVDIPAGAITEAPSGLFCTVDLTQVNRDLRILFVTKDAKVYRFPIGQYQSHKASSVQLVYAEGQPQP